MAPCQRRALGFPASNAGEASLPLRPILSPSFPSCCSWSSHDRWRMRMDDVARVVLALEATQVAEEVLHYLDRSGLARVVATATDDRQLVEAVRQTEPDLVVAQPSLASAARGSNVLALDGRETVGSLRAALEAGARGYFVWPVDRERLLGAVARSGS